MSLSLNQAQAAVPAYLETLNPSQREAVETLDGPLLVLAGAGTGKTRVLITRLAHILVTRRAYPSQILAVTFTNKAAREMRERIGGLIGEGTAEGLWLGTFHSLAARILRRHAELVGLKPELHHSRHRRPDPAGQADPLGREHRRQEVAGARHPRR